MVFKIGLFLQNCSGSTFFTSCKSHEQQPDLATATNHEEENDRKWKEDDGTASFLMTSCLNKLIHI